MSLTNANGLAAANTEFLTLFQSFFGEGLPGTAQNFTTTVPTSGTKVTITNVLSHPRVREWIGPKVVKSLRALTQDIPLKKWEATVGIERVDVDYDRTGSVRQQLNGFLSQQVSTFDDLVYTKLLANPTGYDGVSLLNNSHPYSNSTGDNLTTDALSFSSLEAMDTAMRGFQDEDGRPLMIQPRMLLVGEANRHTALQVTGASRPIFFNNTGAEAATSVIDKWMVENPFSSHAVVVAPWITGSQWFLIDDTKPVGPMVATEGRAFQAVVQDELTDDVRFQTDEYLFSLEGDYGFGAGLWQTIGGRIAS